MRMIERVTRAYDRLEQEFESAVSRGAQKRSQPFYEYANGKVLLDSKAVIEAREGDTTRESEGDFIRSVDDSFTEGVAGRLVPAFTFDEDGQLMVIVVIRP